MFQTVDPPRLWLPPPQPAARPVAVIEGAAAGDKGRTGEQRLAGGQVPHRERRGALKIAPEPDPDPPTGPPPAFSVTPLERLKEEAAAQAEADARAEQPERPNPAELLPVSVPEGDRARPVHVDMKV